MEGNIIDEEFINMDDIDFGEDKIINQVNTILD